MLLGLHQRPIRTLWRKLFWFSAVQPQLTFFVFLHQFQFDLSVLPHDSLVHSLSLRLHFWQRSRIAQNIGVAVLLGLLNFLLLLELCLQFEECLVLGQVELNEATEKLVVLLLEICDLSHSEPDILGMLRHLL